MVTVGMSTKTDESTLVRPSVYQDIIVYLAFQSQVKVFNITFYLLLFLGDANDGVFRMQSECFLIKTCCNLSMSIFF